MVSLHNIGVNEWRLHSANNVIRNTDNSRIMELKRKYMKYRKGNTF